MDAIDLLSEVGRVEPADQAVLDAALFRFTEAVGQGKRPGGAGPGLRIVAGLDAISARREGGRTASPGF